MSSTDYTKFARGNTADSCALWNLFSSPSFYASSRAAGCYYCITRFVQYELFTKQSTGKGQDYSRLKLGLNNEISAGSITLANIEINDLQDAQVLARSRHNSMGEISSMLFARKSRLAFLSDDGWAMKFATALRDAPTVQSTPHLVGWLVYQNALTESGVAGNVGELASYGRSLHGRYELASEQALELCDAKDRPKSQGVDWTASQS